jgi:hypothetical protein
MQLYLQIHVLYTYIFVQVEVPSTCINKVLWEVPVYSAVQVVN